FDLEGHRGGRGENSEETLFSYARALLAGVTTLELDVGITSDGVPVVWHDEMIMKEKCIGEGVGEYIKELSFEQVKALDCGSLRQTAFPRQQIHPGARIQSLQQFFDFVKCADDGEKVHFNIESKLSPPTPNTTVGPQQFVDTLLSSYRSNNVLSRVTFQSFDWRTIIRAKEQEPSIVTVALIDASDLRPIWTAGIDIEAQEGPDLAQKVAQAAKKANADILSPSHGVGEVEVEGYVPFANKTMVDEAHKLGMKVVPYTPNSLFTAEKLLADGVDGLITDYPTSFSEWARAKNFRLPAPGEAKRISRCVAKAQQAEKSAAGKGKG
ncbi:PLC-like phosphodiesterase, partial [Tilletiopsis washingtonensis]